MNRKNKLKAQRTALQAQADTALDAVLAQGRALTAEELQAQTSFSAQLAQLDQLIAAIPDDVPAPAVSVPDAGPISAAPSGTGVYSAIPGAAPSAAPLPGGRITVGGPRILQDPMRGFRNTADFALAVYNASRQGGAVDPRLIEARLISGPDSFGGAPMAAPTNYHQEAGTPEGAMVPPQISQAIWQLVFNDPLLAELTVEPTSSNAVDIIADESTPWGATGVQANWRSEGVQMVPSKLDTKLKQVRLHELYAFVLATGELLEDAPRLNDRLNVKAPAAIRWKMVESFVFGTGAGQPLGWAHTNYAGKILVARTTPGTVKPDDFVNMYARMLVTDGPDRTFWVMNRDTLPAVILNSVIGNIPIFLPSNGLAGAPQGTILGRPVFWSEHAQTKGTAGDVQLINPDGYYATQRGPARFDSSIHLYFDYNIEAFRWMFRFGGMPMLSAAVASAKSAATKSHFVILNT